ncbi:MAG: YkgJ family cysteine cluster protein [Deltaproteobacteria bacterium]|nr:YkgJ family cysteine cluster protein [Deltaproteobacteria bacterium]
MQRVYFPFADGRLGYNCPECGSKCCKGLGLHATHGELQWLLEKYPSLSLFTTRPARAAEPHLLRVINHPPGCFFLDGAGACSVHAKHGREHKPLMCRTFPANRYSLVGHSLVADFGPTCPVRVWEAGSGDFPLRHEELRRDIEGDLEAVMSLASPMSLDDFGEHRILESDLAWEEALRDLPVRSPSLTLFDLCARMTENLAVPRSPDEFERRMNALSRLIGADVDPSKLRSQRILLFLMPRLRLLTARLLPSSYPRGELQRLMPQVAVALAVYLEVYAGTNQSRLTETTAASALEVDFRFLLQLARIDEPPTLESVPIQLVVAPPSGIEPELMRVLDAMVAANGATTTQEILERVVPQPGARSRVMRALADASGPSRTRAGGLSFGPTT